MNFNKRKRKKIAMNYDYSKIAGSNELIKEEGRYSHLNELYFDINRVSEFENLLIFYLPFRSYQKNCFKKEKFMTKLVIVDKTYKYLIIFKSYDDMLKYVSGQQNYQYYYQTQLNSFFSISEIKKIIYNRNLFKCQNNSYQEELYSCNFISKIEKGRTNYFYEFASIHLQKIKIFISAIEYIINNKQKYIL